MNWLKRYWKQCALALLAFLAALAGARATSAKQSRRAAELDASNAPDAAEATHAHESAERLAADDIERVRGHNERIGRLKYIIPLVLLIGCAPKLTMPERTPIELEPVATIEKAPLTTDENVQTLVQLHNEAAVIANQRGEIVKALDTEAAAYQRINARTEHALEAERQDARWKDIGHRILEGLLAIGLIAVAL